MEIINTHIAVCVNHQFKTIFVHIPKNAGSSIKRVFFPGLKCRINKSDMSVYQSSGYKTFTVWREDVVDRFVTAYLEDSKRVDNDIPWMKDMKWYGVKKLKERFMTYLSEAEEYKGFSHCIKQTDAVKDAEGVQHEFDYNFTMKTIPHISEVLFDGRAIPKKQSNHGRKKEIAPFIDRYIVRRIRKLYLDDIRHIEDLSKKGLLWKN